MLGGGAETLATTAGHGRALVEEGGYSARACWRARCPKLGGMSSAIPRGFSGTC
jgi:hypothetical protein